ncbi:MAG: CBS domain-containing protein [Desulfobacterales bacterium]|jgi:CBS domain-containing protein|nr:CBS domain-containing protein [Desulfobacterales bacterium]
MLTAKDIMTPDIITLSPDLEIGLAAKYLLEKRINGAPVVDASGSLVGILCQSDLIATQKKLSLPSLFTLLDGFIPLRSAKQIESEFKKIAALTVAQAMTKTPTTVTLDTPIDEIATLMVEKGFHTLPVLDKGALVGVIGKEDVLKTLTST